LRFIFVFGLFPISPGKTVVATAICRALSNRGFNVAPFKPRSGHDVWYQHDSFMKCVKERRLFCEDITKLREATECLLPYEILNPIDALMTPMKVGDYLKKGKAHEMYLKNTVNFNHLVVERYTQWQDGARDVFYLSKTGLSSISTPVRDYVQDLVEHHKVIEVKNLGEWDAVYRQMEPVCTSTCMDRIADDHELVVVEGFNDAVCPAQGFRYDVVIAVAPCIAAFYDPDDYHRVIEVKSKIRSDPRGFRAEDIIEFIKPEKIVRIPSTGLDTRKNYDKLSQKLEKVVNTTLERIQET
jgi:predicted P-loop ATPase/GTPase